MSLTGIRDLDMTIVALLPDFDLRSLSQCNKTLRSICRDEETWKRKIWLSFGPEYAKEKVEDVTWMEWYFLWKRHPNDIIGKDLRLTLLQRGDRLLVEEGHLRPSMLLYRTIGINLINAFQKKDLSWIDRLMNRYFIIANSVDERVDYVMNYKKAIKAAIRNGFFDHAEVLISRGFVSSIPVKIYRWMAREGKIYSRPSDKNSPIDIQTEIILGLIENGQDDIAMSKLRSHHVDADKFLRFLQAALKSGSDTVLDYLNKELLPSIRPNVNQFEERIYVEYLKAGRSTRKPRFDFYTNRNMTIVAREHAHLILEYLKEYVAAPDFRRIHQRIPQIKTGNYDLLKYCINHNVEYSLLWKDLTLETARMILRHHPKRIRQILSCAVKYGREDFFILLEEYLSHQGWAASCSLTSPLFDCGMIIVATTVQTQYKDIFVYLFDRIMREEFFPGLDDFYSTLIPIEIRRIGKLMEINPTTINRFDILDRADRQITTKD